MSNTDNTLKNDPFNLARFLEAQEDSYIVALEEIKSGKKRTHWMWFVFPQIYGLGHSSTSRFYGIKNQEEAREYLAHPVLGARLREITTAALTVNNRTASEIFGYPDDLKFQSSMTLFERVSEPNPIFIEALEKYYGGVRDQKTLELLGN